MDYKFFLWGFGICASGFFFLAIWVRHVHDRISTVHENIGKKVSEKFTKENVSEDIKEIKLKLNEISEYLTGTLNKKGMVTRLYEVEKHCIEDCPARKEQ